MSSQAQETYESAYPDVPNNQTYNSYGLDFPTSCAKHVEETFKAKRVYIIASPSLVKYSDGLSRLQKALGEKVIGVRMGIPKHTPFDALVEIINDVREKDADCIVTLGGGSISDGAKAVVLGVANSTRTMSDMDKLAEASDAGVTLDYNRNLITPTIPIICIPTSLSAGEYSQFAGVTNPATKRKYQLSHPRCAPSLIILDPVVTLTMPERVWISSGVRAIDHCCEAIANINHDTSVDPSFQSALQMLAANLLVTKAEPENLEARLNCQLGSRTALSNLRLHILPGASHGIGHMLGPLGVGHGETSCILLPAVMKFNARVNSEQQEKIKTALWGEETVKEVLKKSGLQKESSDVGDILDALFRALGMPRTLKEVGVGREKFESLAENSLYDICTKSNPVWLEKKDVLEILEVAAGDQ